jgi:protein NRD1
MVESFREKLRASPPSMSLQLFEPGCHIDDNKANIVLEASTTPPGSPPANVATSFQGAAPASAPPAQNSQSILDALANLARQNVSAAPAAPSVPAPAASYNVPPASGLPQPVSSSMSQPQSQPQPPASYPSSSQPAVNVPPSLPFSLTQLAGQGPSAAQPQPPNLGAFGPSVVPGAPGNAPMDPSTQQQLMLIKALADQGVPFEKIPALLQGLGASGGSGPQGQPPVPNPQNSYAPGQMPWGAPIAKPEENRDWRGGYNEGTRSPGYHQRSRSRSPDRGWGNRNSPRNGRDRMDYGRNSPARGRDGDRNGRRSGDYRDRSPARRRGQSPPPSEKWVDHDPNLPDGNIKVLSRTLFVGGVT